MHTHRKRWRDRNTEKWKREEKGEICLPFRYKTETLIQNKNYNRQKFSNVFQYGGETDLYPLD